MKTEITEVAPCRQKLTVTVPADKVNEAFQSIYDELSGRVQIKGFRRGHTPRKLLEKRFAKDVAKDATAKLFQDSFIEALKEKELAPLGDPDLKIEELEAKEGAEFSYSTEVDVRPKFELPEYKGLELTEKTVPVADAEVDEQISRLQKAFAEYNEVEEGAAAEDYLLVDVTVTSGNEKLIDEKNQRLKVEGELLFGLECKDLVKTLTGVKKGAEKSLTLTLPQEFHKEALRGKPAEVKLSVKAVERGKLPEVDQRLAQMLGCDDVEKLKSRIRENLAADRKAEARRDMERQAVDKLIGTCKFELPEAFLKRLIDSQLIRNKMQLARMGATKELLAEKQAEMAKESAAESERTLRWSIISDAIADKEELEVTETEVQEHIEALAHNYQTTPAKMLKRIRDLNGIASMISEIRDIKVLKLLLDQASIKQEA